MTSILAHYLYLGIFIMIVIIMTEHELPKRKDWLLIILFLAIWPLTTFFFITQIRYQLNGK